MVNATLETTIEPLLGTHLELDSILTSAQITTERRDHNPYDLRAHAFLTADSALYRMEDGEAVLYLGKGDTNLIFRNLVEANKQIFKIGVYRPNEEDIESVVSDAVKAGTVTRYKLSDLGLNTEYYIISAYFEINTSNYDNPSSTQRLSPTQRKFAEQVYGTGEDFAKNMKALQERGIESPKIYVLNPNYVKEKAREDSALVSVCRLNGFYNFSDSSNFNASSVTTRLDRPDYALRGVRKTIDQSDKKIEHI